MLLSNMYLSQEETGMTFSKKYYAVSEGLPELRPGNLQLCISIQVQKQYNSKGHKELLVNLILTS